MCGCEQDQAKQRTGGGVLEPAESKSATSRRGFLKLSGTALGWLAIGCVDNEIVAAPPGNGADGIPVTPPHDLKIDTELAGATAVRADDGELLAYVGPGNIYLWPGGGTRRGPRFIATTSHAGGKSGGYGFQMDRPANSGSPIATMFSIDGQRNWEIGLDMGDDASGQGKGPDLVLAYDNSDPSGDRLRMAPGGYTLHSPTAGTPSLLHRFHVVGGNAEVDNAQYVLYVQAGSRNNPGRAHTLIAGQGFHPEEREWGREVFWVTVDGRVVSQGFETGVSGDGARDLVILRKARPASRGWLRWTDEANDWRMGMAGPDAELVLMHGEEQRFRFAPDGRAYADTGWLTFSPSPPRPADQMTAAAWCDWAVEEARKPVKPYAGIPTETHPFVVEQSERTGRSPAEIAAREQARYGKDVSRVAIGTARWADRVQDALDRATSFAEFRRLLGRG
jgi:hypothetical protein